MARHKKLQEDESEDPALDISSLIDVCFLLLIYFLVATSMAPQEKRLDMQMPSITPNTEQNQAVADPILLIIDEQGTVTWGVNKEMISNAPDQRDLDNLSTRLEESNTAAKAANSQVIVQLSIATRAKQQRVMDVMNSLTKAGISQVALQDVPDEG